MKKRILKKARIQLQICIPLLCIGILAAGVLIVKTYPGQKYRWPPLVF